MLVAVRGLECRGHVVITDNFFTSVKLYVELLKRGFYATGIVKKGLKGFPPSLAGFPNQHRLPRGILMVKMHHSRRIGLTRSPCGYCPQLLTLSIPCALLPDGSSESMWTFQCCVYSSDIRATCAVSTWLTNAACTILQPCKVTSGGTDASPLS